MIKGQTIKKPDEIAYGNASAIGRWGALLEGELDGIPYWTDVSRVTDVSFARDEGMLKVRLWYSDEDSSQHPDVRCMEGKAFDLAPGATFKPTIPMGALIRLLPPEQSR